MPRNNYTPRLYASCRVFTRSGKRPALARVFWIHLLEVCWTFAGSCKHSITLPFSFLIPVSVVVVAAAACCYCCRRSRNAVLSQIPALRIIGLQRTLLGVNNVPEIGYTISCICLGYLSLLPYTAESYHLVARSTFRSLHFASYA